MKIYAPEFVLGLTAVRTVTVIGFIEVYVRVRRLSTMRRLSTGSVRPGLVALALFFFLVIDLSRYLIFAYSYFWAEFPALAALFYGGVFRWLGLKSVLKREKAFRRIRARERKRAQAERKAA